MYKALSILVATLIIGVPFSSHAQPKYAQPGATAAAGGLPPFLASMERHDITLKIMVEAADGAKTPAPADLPIGLRIIAGGAKVRDYTGTTDASGKARLDGVPSNPEVQSSIRYEVWVDYLGVRFPFKLDGVPTDGSQVELSVYAVTQTLAGISAQHSVELFADEESLVARHIIRLYNESDQTVDLGSFEGGGLPIPCPDGAKHPELHDEHNTLAEVRGTRIIYKGALLPAGKGPAVLSFIYTIPYDNAVFEWKQVLPIRTRGVSVATPQHKQPRQRAAIPMKLVARGDFGGVDTVEQAQEKSWSVFRSNGAILKAGEPLRFAIEGLPATTLLPEYVLISAVVLVIFIILFGYRRREGDQGVKLSVSHLMAERDRLVRALARLRKAHEKGKLPTVRFEREEEAVLARLVSVYRAIDLLETP
jgi:hypothetical protein